MFHFSFKLLTLAHPFSPESTRKDNEAVAFLVFQTDDDQLDQLS